MMDSRFASMMVMLAVFHVSTLSAFAFQDAGADADGNQEVVASEPGLSVARSERLGGQCWNSAEPMALAAFEFSHRR